MCFKSKNIPHIILNNLKFIKVTRNRAKILCIYESVIFSELQDKVFFKHSQIHTHNMEKFSVNFDHKKASNYRTLLHHLVYARSFPESLFFQKVSTIFPRISPKGTHITRLIMVRNCKLSSLLRFVDKTF